MPGCSPTENLPRLLKEQNAVDGKSDIQLTNPPILQQCLAAVVYLHAVQTNCSSLIALSPNLWMVTHPCDPVLNSDWSCWISCTESHWFESPQCASSFFSCMVKGNEPGCGVTVCAYQSSVAVLWGTSTLYIRWYCNKIRTIVIILLTSLFRKLSVHHLTVVTVVLW